MGKVFFQLLWEDTTPIKKPFAYGFYAKRRREQAMLVQNATSWKLRKLHINHTHTARDISNAFPSPSHQALSNMIDQVARPKSKAILKH